MSKGVASVNDKYDDIIGGTRLSVVERSGCSFGWATGSLLRVSRCPKGSQSSWIGRSREL